MNEETALIVKERLDVSVIFTEIGMKALLSEIDKKARDFTPDIETANGRKEIASMAHKVARSKTLIDDVGKESIAEYQEKVNNCNKYRRQARDHLDNLKEEVRKPLTDWEAEEERKKEADIAQEKARVEAIQARIQKIKNAANLTPLATQDDIENRIAQVTEWENFDFQELTDEATKVIMDTRGSLMEALSDRREYDKAQAEAKAEAERLEKIRQEQEAERQKLDAEKKTAEEAARKEREALEAEKRKIQEEKDRLEAEKRKAELEEKARRDALKEAQEKAEREAKEKADAAEKERLRKEREEAMRPEKERLTAWLDNIYLDLPELNLEDESLRNLHEKFITNLRYVIQDIKAEVEEL